MSSITLKAKNPDEVRLLGLADAHLTCFNPPSWKASFMEETESILSQVWKFAVDNEVDGILWAGDQFHLKSPARNPLHFISRMLALLKAVAIPHFVVGGNHDLKFGSLTGLEGQPLDVMLKAGAFNLLDENPLILEGRGFTAKVAGCSYIHGRAEPVIDLKKEGADFMVALGHFWFGPTTGEFMGEPMYGPERLGKGEADAYFIGHHHEDQGVPVVDGKHYIVSGSVNRTGGKKSDLERRPAAPFITISKEGIKVRVLRPRIKPSEEVIDFEARKQVLAEQEEMEAFVKSLHQTQVSTSDPRKVLEEMQLANEVRERALRYLSEAGADE